MPTFTDPAADADEAQQAVRGLAHASRVIDDPRSIYPMLGALSSAMTSLSQALHQIASFHDADAPNAQWVSEGSATARTFAYQVSWELHRAGEMMRQIADTIDHAHEAEGHIVYENRAAIGAAPYPSNQPSTCEPRAIRLDDASSNGRGVDPAAGQQTGSETGIETGLRL